jgi:hypothetical protein
MASFADVVRKGACIETLESKGRYCDRCRRTEIKIYCSYEGKDLCMLCCSQIIKLEKLSKDDMVDKTFTEKIMKDNLTRAKSDNDMTNRRAGPVTLMATNRYADHVTKMMTYRFTDRCIIS